MNWSNILLDLRKVRATIFDLDETLIDAMDGLPGAHMAVVEELKAYLENEGIKIDQKTLLNRIRDLDDSMNLKVEYDRDKWWQELLNEFDIKIKLKQEFRRKLTKKYWFTYASLVEPYEDTVPTLEYLKRKGYLLGLITDTDGTPGIKKTRLERLSIYPMFDAIVIAGEDTEHTKPNSEPYLEIARHLKASPEECVFIGDKPHTDIKGAFKAGMKAILIQRRNWDTSIENTPKIVIENLEQLKSFL